MSEFHQTGIYNGGMFGVRNSPDGIDFLDWWNDRLQAHCLSDPRVHMFFDQLALDLVPAVFPRVKVLRDPGLNLAVWNLHERDVQFSKGFFTANSVPVKVFHHTQFKSGPEAVQGYLKAKPSRVPHPIIDGRSCDAVVGEDTKLTQACQDLFSLLSSSIQKPDSAAKNSKYGVFDDGTPIAAETRLVYHHDAEIRRKVSNPFESLTLKRLNKMLISDKALIERVKHVPLMGRFLELFARRIFHARYRRLLSRSGL
jgi:hypothetical protein